MPHTGLPHLPDWVPPRDTGQTNAGDLDDLSLLRKQTFAARNTIIPIVYGRDRVFGQLIVAHVDEVNGFLYVAYSFGQGEITGYETAILDGVDVNDSENGFLLNAGAVVELHNGEPSPSTSTLLSGVLPGYVDTLPDTAYIVLKVPQGSTRGFPRLEAILQGRRVYDPRLDSTLTSLVPPGSGAHRVGDPSTWIFSTNPALCFRDLIENFTGWDILDQGVADLAVHNDVLISGVKRREIGLALNKPTTVENWVKGFRTYMGAFLAWEGGFIRVIPNHAEASLQRACKFDGTAGTWINVGDLAVLEFTETEDFTVEFVFKMGLTTGAIQVLVGKKAGTATGTAGYTIFMDASDDLVCRIDDGTNDASDTDTTTNFFDSEWHHVAMTIDQTANEMIMVVDNVARTPVSISGVTATLVNAQAFRIGANGAGTELVDGLVDEVRVWDDERTSTEISDNRLIEIPDPTSDASLVGYWRLNDDPSSMTAIDSSSNTNDGTLAGAAVFVDGYKQVIPEGIAMHILVDDIVKDSLSLSRRSLRSVPNSVAIDYEDSSGSKWHTERVQTDSPRVTSGDEARRLSRISLPGIHNASQAQREATERLNWYLTDLEATLTLFDEGWELQTGSVVAVTHPIGLDAKLFRVRRLTSESGRWVLDLVEYDPAIYSEEVIADPTTPDTNLGDPLKPPTITGLSLTEELFTYKNGLTGSRVRATWTATNYPFFSQYLVEGYVDGVRVWQSFTSANDVVTPAVEELVSETAVTYEIRVYIQSPFAQGSVVTDTVSILGKLAVPGDVPTLDLTVVAVDQVDITWGEAIDIDIWRYDLRLGTPSDSFATATQIDLVDGLQYTKSNLAIGTHRFFIKARDSVGNESTNAIFTDITLSKPTAVLSVTGFEVASEVRLNWPAVTGGFVERYRISYDTSPTPTAEITLDTVDTLRFQTKDVPEGTFEFSIWAQDKNGIEADTAATIVIEVTSDADAFLADTYNFDFSTDEHAVGTLTNVVSYNLRIDTRTFFVTNMGDSFAVSPTDFVAADPLANYHAVGASAWLSETKDFGVLLTGSWNLTHDVTALLGNVTIELELSADDATYVVFTGAAKGEFRYARVRISTFNPPGTATSYVKTPLMSLKVNVVPLEESGEATSTASAGIGKTIPLSREYTALKEIVAQPKNTAATGTAVTAVVDTIVIGPNTAVLSDGTNYLDGGDVTAFDFGASQDASIEFLTKHTGGTGTKRLVGKRDGANGGWNLDINETTEDLIVELEDASANNVTTTITDAVPDDGQYHHLAITIDRTADELRVYVDTVADAGNPFTISTITGALDGGTAAFRTHANSVAGAVFDGPIDELRIWDDVRTAGEIAANDQAEVAVEASLIGYWKMDGTIGAAVSLVQDETANNNDLTDTGAGATTYLDPGDIGNTIQKVNSFDVFIWDTFGQQLSEEFQWKWKAV